MEKQKTTVRVAGKDYALVSTDSPEHLNRVAAYVDPVSYTHLTLPTTFVV